MFRKKCINWLACVAAALLANAGVTRADTWSAPNGCGCGQHSTPTSWTESLPAVSSTGSFWMRQAPPYNSSWARVPVTNYRPQVVNDPLSGVSVTSLQPCNTYEWQMRRTAGCSLWRRLVDWWRCHCFCGGRPTPSSATTCTPTSDWIVSSSQPAASPYYAPANNAPSSNGRLVPVPSNVTPTSPVPADRRPQLNPLPQRPVSGGSAARTLPLDTEVFVRILDDSDTQLELTPPLVAPVSQDAGEDVSDSLQPVPELPSPSLDDPTAAVPASMLEEIPVSSSVSAVSADRKLPTDEVWDDTGWRSEQ